MAEKLRAIILQSSAALLFETDAAYAEYLVPPKVVFAVQCFREIRFIIPDYPQEVSKYAFEHSVSN